MPLFLLGIYATLLPLDPSSFNLYSGTNQISIAQSPFPPFPNFSKKKFSFTLS